MSPTSSGAGQGADRVAVIGLGLIGGSMARDLASAGYRVLAYDHEAASLADARAEGVVHEILDATLTGIESAGVVVFAVPVTSLAAALLDAAPRLSSASVIMDVGSTKRSALTAAEAAGIGDRFVGSHPMAGDHRSGWQASRQGLFSGAKVYLCRTTRTRAEAFDHASQLWTALGATIDVMDAAAHDHLVAYTSHLPQMVAKCLAVTIADAGAPHSELGPGGRDVTRLAASPSEAWVSIALDNADELVGALQSHEARLVELRRALEESDSHALRALFSRAQRWAGGAAPVAAVGAGGSGAQELS